MFLIGSRAIRHWFSDFREPKDWDLVGTYEEIIKWKDDNRPRLSMFKRKHENKFQARMEGNFIELDILLPGSSYQLLETETSIEALDTIVKVPDPEYLYMIKRCLVYWPVHWFKTIDDVHWLKPRIDNVDSNHEFWQLRLKEYEEKFGRPKVNLNMPNERFFAKSENSLQRQYEHDFLHETIAYYDRPLYERFKRDLSKALLSEKLFNAASQLDKERLVREEAMAIALERYIIPGKITDAVFAYQRAVSRICTTLTTGWFREFAIENWPSIKEPDKDYVSIFWEKANLRDCGG